MRTRTTRALCGAVAITMAAATVGIAPAAGAGAAPAAPLSVGVERAVSTARPGNAQANVDVAWNGSMFFAVWEESPVAGGPTAVYGARILTDGTVLDPNGILVASDEFDSFIRPKVAGGANRFLVVFERAIEGTYSDLDAALVAPSGQVLKQWGLSRVDNGQSRPDVAWGGSFFLAVWQDEPEPENADIYGARVLPSGLTIDGCSTDSCFNGDDPGVRIADGASDQTDPAVAASGDMFLVSFTDDVDATGTRARHTAVALIGESLDPDGGAPLSAGTGAQTDTALTSNGATSLAAWTEVRAGSATDIRATTLRPGDEQNWNPAPVQPNGIGVSSARNAQSNPDVARRSGHFVAVWTDLRSGGADIYASRVGALGGVLDPNGVAIAAGPRQQRLPAVATSGRTLLVAYQRDAPAAPFNGTDRVQFRIVS